MRNAIFSITLFTLASWCASPVRLDAQTNTTTEKPGATAAATNSVTPEAEVKFKALLTGATLSGRWCMVAEGKMGEDKTDQYNIVDAQKLGGDSWVIHAHVKYGEADFVAPIPVKIKWAGDTPILMVDKLQVPGGGTYTARVMFYDKTYSGTWSGGTHGGLLHGVITNEKP